MIWSLVLDYLPQIGAGLLAVLAAVGLRQSGKSKIKRKLAEKRAEALKNRIEVQNDVQGMDDDRVRNELDKWMRDAPDK